jgi:MoxR-like ATPase
MQCSKALALIKGRTHVIPEDIKELRYSVLRHRISLNFSAIADNVTVEQIIDAIIGAIQTP